MNNIFYVMYYFNIAEYIFEWWIPNQNKIKDTRQFYTYFLMQIVTINQQTQSKT